MARVFNILLIEDDQLIQYAMVEGLSDVGHVVSVAGTSNRAIDVLTHHHYYDVILLDLRLGEDRGEEIFSRLSAGGVDFPPVIIVSAQPMTEIAKAAKAIPASKSLQKPVSIVELCEAMHRVVA